MKKILLFSLIFSFTTAQTLANDFEELCKQGYAVVARTKFDNSDFNGCEFGQRIKLSNGLTFECKEYKYNYSYNPDVYILENRYGDIKVIINDDEFNGVLYR